mgnify:CR=1 FL=1
MAEEKKNFLSGLLQNLPQLIQQYEVNRRFNKDPRYARDFIAGQKARQDLDSGKEDMDYKKSLVDIRLKELEKSEREDKEKESSVQELVMMIDAMDSKQNLLDDPEFKKQLLKRGVQSGNTNMLKLALGVGDEKGDLDIAGKKSSLEEIDFQRKKEKLDDLLATKTIEQEEYNQLLRNLMGVKQVKKAPSFLGMKFGKDIYDVPKKYLGIEE